MDNNEGRHHTHLEAGVAHVDSGGNGKISLWYAVVAETPFGFIRGLVNGNTLGLSSMKAFDTDEFLQWGRQWLGEKVQFERATSRSQAAAQFRDDVDRLLHGEQPQLKPDLSRNTAFQVQVANAVLQIPFGAVASYGAIAVTLGKPGGAQAVGQALPKLPFTLYIPTHRVVRTTGVPIGCTLHSFELKTDLLQWEQERAREL